MEPVITMGIGHWDTSAKWQVIFKTAEGKDYCRETLPANKALAEVKSFAVAACAQHGLAGADIQRF